MRLRFGFLQFGLRLYEVSFAILTLILYLPRPAYAEPFALVGAAGIGLMEFVVFMIDEDLPFDVVARALFG